MTHLLRSLIRETLLLEEVYGAQAVVYHGTDTDPEILIQAILNDKFVAGERGGAEYGKGLYAVYDMANAKTTDGDYGDWIVKLKVNLYGYIIFDPDIALKVYKKPLTLAQQAEEFGYSDEVIERLRHVQQQKSPFRKGDGSSRKALSASVSLKYKVKGLVYSDDHTGKVVLAYDPTTTVPISWKRIFKTAGEYREPVDEPWIAVKRSLLLNPLRRSAIGDFETGKWDPLTIFNRIKRLPEDQRIVQGKLDISDSGILEVPKNFKVSGNLILDRNPITSLPPGLKVGGTLSLYKTSIESLPADLKVGYDLYLNETPVTSLPAGIEVGNFIYGLDRKHWANVPQHLKEKLQ